MTYVHQDHLSGTSLTTDSSGNEVATIKYLPFGGTRLETGALDTDKRFTGQRLDESGLYFYNARYYDAAIGRFISPDSIVPDWTNPQNLNTYSYVLNNPLKYVDPTGLFEETALREWFGDDMCDWWRDNDTDWWDMLTSEEHINFGVKIAGQGLEAFLTGVFVESKSSAPIVGVAEGQKQWAEVFDDEVYVSLEDFRAATVSPGDGFFGPPPRMFSSGAHHKVANVPGSEYVPYFLDCKPGPSVLFEEGGYKITADGTLIETTGIGRALRETVWDTVGRPAAGVAFMAVGEILMVKGATFTIFGAPHVGLPELTFGYSVWSFGVGLSTDGEVSPPGWGPYP